MYRGEGPLTQASFNRNDIAPTEHMVQFYSTEDELLDTLSAYIGEGLKTGESAIVIATPEHLRALRYGLEKTDADLMRAMFEDRYITLEAGVALTSFMVDGLPDERLFDEMARTLLRRASASKRRVRAFGEMVALLWARGNREATVRLEQLWDKFCRTHGVMVLCSYPKAAFPEGVQGSAGEAVSDIRAAHTLSI
jgi:MEDS: MEthanogen/methylotroph, DcmR Sensory domain